MKRVVSRTVSVQLTEADVRQALLNAARCQTRWREGATVEQNGDGITVSWVEIRDSDHPMADPSLDARKVWGHTVYPCPPRAEDHEGRRYGHQVVLGFAGERDKHGGLFWLVKCDCGDVRTVRAYTLKHQNNRSCSRCRIKHGKEVRVTCAEKGCEVRSSVKAQILDNGRWRCARCREINRRRTSARCKKRRAKESTGRVCRSCWRTDSEAVWSGRLNECMVCARRGERNGRCESCGYCLYKTKEHTCKQEKE